MIKYSLICSDCSYNFDSWFASSDKCDVLLKSQLVNCPQCNSTDVGKALMAPAIPKKSSAKKVYFDYVGEKFAEEVRAQHYGEKPSKNVVGLVSHEDAAELNDEGIDFLVLDKQKSN